MAGEYTYEVCMETINTDTNYVFTNIETVFFLPISFSLALSPHFINQSRHSALTFRPRHFPTFLTSLRQKFKNTFLLISFSLSPKFC